MTPATADLLITDAVLHGGADGTSSDVRISGGVVAEITPAIASTATGEVLDADGATLLPGLHDHHIHLLSLAASLSSVVTGPPAVTNRTQLGAALSDAAHAAPPGAWLRGVGYHESVAGPLDRWSLDALITDRPVRLQHRSGALWMLNSTALVAAGLDGAVEPGVERDGSGRVTGRLFRADALLRERVPRADADLRAAGALLASYGVTGVTDATPDLATAAEATLAEAAATGALPQRVTVLGRPGPSTPPLATGPHKLMLDEARGIDLEAVVDRIGGDHRAGRAVAIHCVTITEVVIAVEAIARAGAFEGGGDRLEHASELPRSLDDRLRELGITVVTQPNFVAERGDDYRAEVPETDHDVLYRCASLLDAGVEVAAGTDAPFGRPDPWAAMAAAATRRTRSGHVLGPDDRVTPARALTLFLGPADRPGAAPRRIVVGGPADLCLLHCPLAEALESPSASAVRATIAAGRLVFSAT